MSPKRSIWCTFIALTLSFIFILLILTACGSSEEKNTPTPEATVTGIEGAVPVLTTGDKWVMKAMSDGQEFTATTEVTGNEVVNGINCYVASLSMDSYSGKQWIDKTTFFPVKVESPWDTTTYSYKFEGDTLYPLKVNKECTVAETVVTTSKENGESNTQKNTYLYKVEKMEQITVPAGTFMCFKIVQYDKDGKPTATKWESAETKMYMVKGEEPESNVTMELISYSISK